MKYLFFALPLLLAGCAAYEPAPIDWAKESAALAATPRKIELSVDDVRVRTVAFSPALNALRQAHAASKAKAAASGWWEDPALNADFLRILSAPENPLVYGGSLAFTIPLSGIPALEKRAAEAYAEADRWALVAAERDAAGEAAVEAVTARETAAFARTLERTLDGTNYVAALDVARAGTRARHGRGRAPREDDAVAHVRDHVDGRRTRGADADERLRGARLHERAVRARRRRAARGRRTRARPRDPAAVPGTLLRPRLHPRGRLQPAGDHRGPHASALEPQPRGHRHGHGHARRGAPGRTPSAAGTTSSWSRSACTRTASPRRATSQTRSVSTQSASWTPPATWASFTARSPRRRRPCASESIPPRSPNG